MRLVYLDEAGSASDEVQQPIITVAATILHGDLQTGPIEADAKEIIESMVPESYRQGFEFHAKELFSGSPKLRGWQKDGPTGRHATLKAFMGLFGKHNLPILTASLYKAGLWRHMASRNIVIPPAQRAHFPHEAAFQFCAVHVEGWFLQNARYERGLCIADETKAKVVLKNNLKMYRAGMYLAAEGMPEPISFRLDHLIDTIYFGNSHDSVMLQLADVCAFFIKRAVMDKLDAAPFFRIIREQMPEDPRVIFR